MNTLLWVLQIFIGLYFIGTGYVHFSLPEGLPGIMAWMYDLSEGLHKFSGLAEILGGFGLILPSITKIKPQLTGYAGYGLAIVMIGAAFWHFPRAEYLNMGMNIFMAIISIFIGYSRLKTHPIDAKE